VHVGLIVDGARRWALANGVPLVDAYARAFSAVRDLVQELFLADVAETSLYLLSRDNLQRSPADLDAVFTATTDFLRSALIDIATEFGARITVAGDATSVPSDYRDALTAAVRATAANSERSIYLLVAYSPAEELASAWVPGITDMATLIARLWVPSRVDLVVRTGGAALLSDFLPLQCGYARIWWTPKSFSELKWTDVRAEVIAVRDAVQSRGR
jgi:undecaprenyl diphosphate synthase